MRCRHWSKKLTRSPANFISSNSRNKNVTIDCWIRGHSTLIDLDTKKPFSNCTKMRRETHEFDGTMTVRIAGKRSSQYSLSLRIQSYFVASSFATRRFTSLAAAQETKNSRKVWVFHYFVVPGGESNKQFRFILLLQLQVDMFELKTNTRKKLPNMKVARDDFQPIVIDQFIYVFGGFDGERAITDCERYARHLETIAIAIAPYFILIRFSFDMRLKKWKLLQPMPTARYAYSAAVMNGFIFVAGGCKHEDQVKRNLVQRYDPAKNEWTKVARVMDPRFEGVLVEWNGFLYAVGVNKAVERYDSVRDEWVNIEYRIAFICISLATNSIKIDLFVPGTTGYLGFRRCNFDSSSEMATEADRRRSAADWAKKL